MTLEREPREMWLKRRAFARSYSLWRLSYCTRHNWILRRVKYSSLLSSVTLLLLLLLLLLCFFLDKMFLGVYCPLSNFCSFHNYSRSSLPHHRDDCRVSKHTSTAIHVANEHSHEERPAYTPGPQVNSSRTPAEGRHIDFSPPLATGKSVHTYAAYRRQFHSTRAFLWRMGLEHTRERRAIQRAVHALDMYDMIPPGHKPPHENAMHWKARWYVYVHVISYLL